MAAPGAGGSTRPACVLLFHRAEIEDGALAGRGLEIAWAADPIDLFFLQIQGSGRLRCPTAA
jgi:membrane-bound lytic murein transglycosylase A